MTEEKKDKPDFSAPLKALKIIKEKEGKKISVQGSIPCPGCGADSRYSIASNGHIHWRCPGCGMGFMQ